MLELYSNRNLSLYLFLSLDSFYIFINTYKLFCVSTFDILVLKIKNLNLIKAVITAGNLFDRRLFPVNRRFFSH